MVNVTIECPICEKSIAVHKGLATVECLGCYTVIKNPVYNENLYKNGRLRLPRKPDAHEDASDRDIKTYEAMTKTPEFESFGKDWQNRKRYRKD